MEIIMNEYHDKYDDMDDNDNENIEENIEILRNKIKESTEKNKRLKRVTSFYSLNIDLSDELLKATKDYEYKIFLVGKLKKNLSDNADFLMNLPTDEMSMTIDEIIDKGLEYDNYIKAYTILNS